MTVIAAFHVNVWLRVNAVVDEDLKPVALPDRRNSAPGAVAEKLRNLHRGRQFDVIIEADSERLQADASGSGKYHQQVTAISAEHNTFGHAVARDGKPGRFVPTI